MSVDASATFAARADSASASRDIVLWVTGITLAVLLFVTVFATMIAPYKPNAVDPLNIASALSGSHVLGTDDAGRDILSRLVVGTRSTLTTPLFVILFATVFAVPLALTAAWRGGITDGLLSRVIDVLFAVPGILLAIVAVALFGSGRFVPALALAIAYTPYVARVTRAAALKERGLSYVQALEVQGVSAVRISRAHVLPNIFGIVASQAIILYGYAIADLAALSYLGLGVQPPTADWGLMVADGQNDLLAGRSAEMLSAAVAIVVVIVTVNLFADRLLARWETAQ